VRCRLTILGITKEDVGEGDSLKAAFSDALKRAAVKFGVSRYLYSLPSQWVDLDDSGNIHPKALKKLQQLLVAEDEEEEDEI
ncbi:Rad52/22 double-strand break repair protein, partial [Thermus scotoductus]